MKKTNRLPAKTTAPPSFYAAQTAPFMEHVAELRRRVFFVALSVVIWSAAAYGVQHHIIDILLAPSHGQKFIYTSPIGGMNFLFKVCFYIGFVASIPVLVYNCLRFIQPLMRRTSARFIRLGSMASAGLALAGMLFGYFIGLPAALRFLLHQFITSQVSPLLTIEAYFSFVVMYMTGAALMFQIPLIVLFINRIKPLTPQQLFRSERWVILGSVILAFIMNPTPSLIDQLFLAIPMIASYQLSIGLIWWLNRRGQTVTALRLSDEKVRDKRLQQRKSSSVSWQAAARTTVMTTSASNLNSLPTSLSAKPTGPVRPIAVATPTTVPAPPRRPAQPARASRRPASMTDYSQPLRSRPIRDILSGEALAS